MVPDASQICCMFKNFLEEIAFLYLSVTQKNVVGVNRPQAHPPGDAS